MIMDLGWGEVLLAGVEEVHIEGANMHLMTRLNG
jgi:hypothetical protein